MTGLGVGTVTGSSLSAPLSLSGTLHVPELKCNLVSLVQLANKRCSLTFGENGKFEVTQGDKVALTGRVVDGFMELDLDLGKSNPIKPTAYVSAAC